MIRVLSFTFSECVLQCFCRSSNEDLLQSVFKVVVFRVPLSIKPVQEVLRASCMGCPRLPYTLNTSNKFCFVICSTLRCWTQHRLKTVLRHGRKVLFQDEEIPSVVVMTNEDFLMWRYDDSTSFLSFMVKVSVVMKCIVAAAFVKISSCCSKCSVTLKVCVFFVFMKVSFNFGVCMPEIPKMVVCAQREDQQISSCSRST